MFDEKEQATSLDGMTVQDAWIALQLMEKSAASGVIQPNEFEVVGKCRSSLVGAIEKATGKNFDDEVMKLRQQQAAAQAAAQAANDVEVPANE